MTRTLLKPLILPNSQTLANRFFKSAMSETMGDKFHNPSTDLLALYDHWADQGMGVLVTGMSWLTAVIWVNLVMLS